MQGKTWHQLQEAYHRSAKQIWVFNVGDIKPMEIPLTFAMALAWNFNSISSHNFPNFFETMAAREFGEDRKVAIAKVWHGYDQLVSLRKHEHIESDTLSLLNYNEAETILSRWKDLLMDAETIYQRVTEKQKPAVFELVLHPVKATCIYVNLRITLGRNQLYAKQRRNTANKAAHAALALFDADFDLQEEFHALLDRKWNHIMRQTHYGYGDTWHAPSRDMIGGLYFVQQRQDSNPISGQMGIAVEGHEGIRPGRTNEESDRTHPSRRDLVPGVSLKQISRYGPKSRWFEIFTRGKEAIHWTATAPFDWVKLSIDSGTLFPGEDDVRVDISINWDQVPKDFANEILVNVRSEEGDFEQIHLPVKNQEIPLEFKDGFVESDGVVSIPASAAKFQGPYLVLPETGRLLQGSVVLREPFTNPTDFLTYNVYLFNSSSAAKLVLYFNMTLDLDPHNLMQYDLQLDSENLETHRLVGDPIRAGELPPGWYYAVQDCTWKQTHDFKGTNMQPGHHTIRIRLKHSNLILEKLVLDLGGLQPSYLGPPPSTYVSDIP
jgi:hypothetical protein